MNDTLDDEIPLFPLPNVVLFPGTRLPLHIFEPRYRDMVATAAAGSGLIGMVVLRGDWQQNYEGSPEIYPVGCVGRIVEREPLPDGRSNLVLLGRRRFQIVEEFTGQPYRRARVEWLDDPREAPAEAVLTALRQAVDALLRGRAETTIDIWSGMPTEVSELVDHLAFVLPLSPLEKLALLECAGCSARAARLVEIVEFRVAEARVPREGRGPCH